MICNVIAMGRWWQAAVHTGGRTDQLNSGWAGLAVALPAVLVGPLPAASDSGPPHRTTALLSQGSCIGTCIAIFPAFPPIPSRTRVGAGLMLSTACCGTHRLPVHMQVHREML